MRRKKLENITDEIRDNVEMMSNFIHKDVLSLEESVLELKNITQNLNKMKHINFMDSRKILLNISKKSKEIRNTLLETHKMFTVEYKK